MNRFSSKLCAHCGQSVPIDPERNDRIFVARWEGRIYRDIAKEYGLSASRIKDICDKGFRKLVVKSFPQFLTGEQMHRLRHYNYIWRQVDRFPHYRGETIDEWVGRVTRNLEFEAACEAVEEAQREVAEIRDMLFNHHITSARTARRYTLGEVVLR